MTDDIKKTTDAISRDLHDLGVRPAIKIDLDDTGEQRVHGECFGKTVHTAGIQMSGDKVQITGDDGRATTMDIESFGLLCAAGIDTLPDIKRRIESKSGGAAA